MKMIELKLIQGKNLITVTAYKGKMIVKNGFANIVKGNHKSYTKVNAEIIEEFYEEV